MDFPRVRDPIKVKKTYSLPFSYQTIDYLTLGTPCKRFLLGGTIEQGKLFLDSSHGRIIFRRLTSLSLKSREIVELKKIIKIKSGHDKRSAFARSIEKFKLSNLIFNF